MRSVNSLGTIYFVKKKKSVCSGFHVRFEIGGVALFRDASADI